MIRTPAKNRTCRLGWLLNRQATVRHQNVAAEPNGLEHTTQPGRAQLVRSWDAVADVVVLGFGCAGAAAAIAAAQVGGEVLLVERSGGAGGASALSGGWIYLGGGTPVQRACGFSDSAEEMERFLLVALGPEADEAKIPRATPAGALPTSNGSQTSAFPSDVGWWTDENGTPVRTTGCRGWAKTRTRSPTWPRPPLEATGRVGTECKERYSWTG